MRDCSREIPSELPPLPQWSCNSRSGPGKRRLQPRSCREHRERRRIFRSAETACGTLLLRSGIPPFTWRAVRVGRGRSEERRVGKECRWWWGPEHVKEKQETAANVGERQQRRDDDWKRKRQDGM